jgi:Spy/CpxP family protein refolding chaperone
MNKKIIILAMALALPLTVAASSGDKDYVGGHHGNRIEHMTKSLDLTAEQKTKVEALFKEQGEKSKIIHEETQARLQAVLSKEQLTKMTELKKQRHEKWQKKHEALTGQKAVEQTQ